MGGMTEREFQATVVSIAAPFGWRVYHTHDSRRSDPGFPDLVLARPPRLVFAELKSEKGRVRPYQQEWLDDLGACEGAESYLWRPSDLDTIVKVLSRTYASDRVTA